jgi:hypothetical protein
LASSSSARSTRAQVGVLFGEPAAAAFIAACSSRGIVIMLDTGGAGGNFGGQRRTAASAGHLAQLGHVHQAAEAVAVLDVDHLVVDGPAGLADVYRVLQTSRATAAVQPDRPVSRSHQFTTRQAHALGDELDRLTRERVRRSCIPAGARRPT